MGLPKTFMGLDCQKSLDKILKQKEVDSKPRAVVQQLFDKAKYIYVPSIDLYVSKEIEYKNNNWVNCHKLLSQNNQRMLTLSDFIEFLKYCKTDYPKIYNSVIDITDNIGRCEWLDTSFNIKRKEEEFSHFKKKEDLLYISSNYCFNSKGDLIPKNIEIFCNDTLTGEFGTIIRDDFFINHTSQGLPNNTVKFLNCRSEEQTIWYTPPKDKSVARFCVSFFGYPQPPKIECDISPYSWGEVRPCCK